MNQKRFKEFKVVLDNKGKIKKKELTDRGSVSITERTAEFNNSIYRSTLLVYELDPKQPAGPKAKTTEKETVKKK